MKKYAFTLIELLIVLVIIGILATLAIPRYQGMVIKAQGAEAMTALRSLADAVWSYKTETGDFPRKDVEGPFPTVLDVKIPATTKYYRYTYQYMRIVPEVRLLATYIDYAAVPSGSVGVYYIFFEKDMPPTSEQFAIQMDAEWYMYFRHELRTSSGWSTKEKWPS